MGEFASKGLANGIGIPALVLGSLGFLQSGGLGSGLGGLFGGGTSQAALMANAAAQSSMMEKDSLIAQLKSEKYADQVGIGVYKQAAADNKELRENVLGEWVKPLAQESAANRERIAVLEAKVQCDREKAELRERIVTDRIDMVAERAASGIAGNSAAIAHLGKIVDSITTLHIPATAVCPEPMARWNSWTAPTSEAPAVQPISGTVNVNNK